MFNQTPPLHSWVDGNEQRFVTLAVDIMTDNCTRFYATMRTLCRVRFDTHFGKWVVDINHVCDEVFERYATLKAIRNKVNILLDDAKPVKTINPQPYMAVSNNNHYDKKRNCRAVG